MLLTLLLFFGSFGTLHAQEDADVAVAEEVGSELEQSDSEVPVTATPADVLIEQRLRKIFDATTWFNDLTIEVDEGVVFLNGVTANADQANWATDLALRTEGVVGVANRLIVDEKVEWSLDPAWASLRGMTSSVIRKVPMFLFGLVLFIVGLCVTWGTHRFARRILSRRGTNQILIQVGSVLIAVPVLILALYVFLQVAGLTRLAATVLGGTGLIGLALGIAFRDVAENFLASVLISIKRPFRIGHLIEVEGYKGYVQSVTTRGTLLMTIDGNHVHIPNANVYKSTVTNLSANPRSRFTVKIGVGYIDSPSDAQAVCFQVLKDHDAVLEDPEPLVLIEELAASTVDIRVYFWVDVSKHSGAKVRSSITRMLKQAIEDAGLTMPGDVRELVFPDGPPFPQAKDGSSEGAGAPPEKTTAPSRAKQKKREQEWSEAEGDLRSEAEEIREQANQSEDLGEGHSLVTEETEEPPHTETHAVKA